MPHHPPPPALQDDAVVIGAGAAGLMCAIEAGKRGRRVAVLEHNARVGLKIAISGGGRCNFTNLGATAENYLSANPDFCKSALARYTPWDFVALVEKHGVRYHEKTLGQQFCDTSSRAIIELLLRECAAAGVEVRTGCRVESVSKPERWRLATSQGEMECASLVVATGGLSFPKLGASDFGYRVARQFGLKLTELRPGLVPLTFAPEDARLGELSGLVAAGGSAVRRRGICGSAALHASRRERARRCCRPRRIGAKAGRCGVDLLPGANGAWLADARRANARSRRPARARMAAAVRRGLVRPPRARTSAGAVQPRRAGRA